MFIRQMILFSKKVNKTICICICISQNLKLYYSTELLL